MADRKWNWLGDHLTVDFANTVRRCGRQKSELLEKPNDLAQWLDLERHRVPVPRHVDEAILQEFIGLRSHCLELLDAAYAGKKLPSASVTQVNNIVARHPLPRVLTARAGRVEVIPASSGDSREDLKATLADAIVEFLAAEDLHNLAFCEAPNCGQFFHRRRPNQSWCCPACGDRVRAARYYERRKKPQ